VLDVAAASAHLRFAEREAVVEALRRLGAIRGAPIAVWPPRPLPPGIFASPPVNGWVSLWSLQDDLDDLLPELTATLECPGVLVEVIESREWRVTLTLDGRDLGTVQLPTELVSYETLMALTADTLQDEGHPDPDDALFEARAAELVKTEAFRDELRATEAARPTPADLASFLPPQADVKAAWDLLFRIDRDLGEDWMEADYFAEDYAEEFTAHLGIEDACWSPLEDADALAEGDYEEGEGLPAAWREFVLLPTSQLRVLG
jgi:hypothetical protein